MNYTSLNLDNRSAQETSERLLMYLKQAGAASTAELSRQLKITAEAARLQVQKLVATELLEGAPQASGGVGRPRQEWRLTARGHAQFPDAHAQLARQLIGSIKNVFGEGGMERLIAQREEETRRNYEGVLNGLRSLKARLERLVTLRAAEGYMARLERDGHDWLVIEDHCPICAAATACQGFCRSELQLFQELLGDAATIRRDEHLLSGARRCVYRVMPTPKQTPMSTGEQ